MNEECNCNQITYQNHKSVPEVTKKLELPCDPFSWSYKEKRLDDTSFLKYHFVILEASILSETAMLLFSTQNSDILIFFFLDLHHVYHILVKVIHFQLF